MDKVAKQVNQGQPDPLTKRVMSDDCWNNKHRNQNQYTPVCSGWIDQCSTCDRRHGATPGGCGCACHQRRCECACHDPKEYQRKIKRDKDASMHIMDSGCGTIEIK